MTVLSAALKTFSLAALITSQSACAMAVKESQDSKLLNNADNQYAHWNGIGKLFQIDRAGCTATLLDTRDTETSDSGPAYVLTAAHCISPISGPKADVAYQATIKFNYFNDTAEHYQTYQIHKANWTSLAGTDLAVLELTASLDSLIAEGIRPLKLADTAPTAAGEVHVVGSPEGLAQSGLRLSVCTQEPADTTLVKPLVVHTRYQKHNCKGIGPGSSGGPVIDPATGDIVGVLSGTTYGIEPESLCFWHGLCKSEQTQSALPDEASHSFPADHLQGCFEKGHFNADASKCTLKPNFDFASHRTPNPHIYLKPKRQSDKTPTWDVAFTISTPLYRFKTVRDAKACYLPEHYSDVISSSNAFIKAPVGRTEGMYFLCLSGVESAEQTPSIGLFRNTQILTARVAQASQPPDSSFTTTIDNEYLLLEWRKGPAGVLWTQIHVSSATDTDCSAVDQKRYQRIDDSVIIPLAALPLTLCSFNMALDMRTSPVRTDLLQRP